MLTRVQLQRLRRTATPQGNKIKLAMELAEVTQVQVSKKIGISQSQVSEDAAGKCPDMSLDKSRAYARLFGCTVDDLFPSEQAMAS
jgi:predicted XRE-type DNA-binding protein